MGVLHVVPSLHPGHGGTSSMVAMLTDALANRGDISIGLLSQGARDAPTVGARSVAVERHVVTTGSAVALALGLAARQGLRETSAQARPPALIHAHGVWHPVNHWTARAARSLRVPLMIQPHGMLEPWALQQKAFKKRLALALFQRRDLESARVLVATAEMEYEHLRQLGLRQPVAVIPNGVDLPETDGGVRRHVGARREAERVLLFLSRIHPKKGVVELVEAWSAVAPAGWRLCIAGPDEGGHWGEVARRVERLGVRDSVTYLGPVAGEAKTAVFRDADLFVLPTFSENFGLVVAEALAHGVPVITTRGAPWSDLESHGCGWWVETGVAPLVAVLRSAMGLSDAERAAMGARGRIYVERFAWTQIAEQMVSVYRWVLGEGERPLVVYEA